MPQMVSALSCVEDPDLPANEKKQSVSEDGFDKVSASEVDDQKSAEAVA